MNLYLFGQKREISLVMIQGFNEFKDIFDKKEIKFNREFCLKHVIHQIINNDEINPQIFQQIEESTIIVFDEHITSCFKYFIICFEGKLLIIDQSNQDQMNLLSEIKSSEIYFLSELQNTFIENFNAESYKNKKKEYLYFLEEIKELENCFQINQKYDKPIKNFWCIISPCIFGYLIKKNYPKRLNFDVDEYLQTMDNSIIQNFDESDFVCLRQIDNSSSIIDFSYNIKTQQFFAIKKFGDNAQDLFNREIENYNNIKYPLIPKFYGSIKNKNSFVFEYINGSSLSNIKNMNLNIYQKFIIIFEILFTIQYFHIKNFIYRDLKPNNIIIDSNKKMVLIDFDKMINDNRKYEIDKSCFSRDFGLIFSSPEIICSNLFPSFKSDIYSIGMLIYFILMEKEPDKNKNKNCDLRLKYPEMYEIFKECSKLKPKKRPSIIRLINDILQIFLFTQLKVEIKSIEDNIKILSFIENMIYYIQISEEKNDSNIQNDLGNLYYENQYLKSNLSKSMHYYQLSNKRLNSCAAHNIALFYYEGIYLTKDINKAIHYFTLGSNRGNISSRYFLGYIFYEGIYVKRNIDLAIHFLTSAAESYHIQSELILGNIFFEGIYITMDLNLSIRYYNLAAKQNNIEAQIILGKIYYDYDFISKNLEETIQYLIIGSNQGDVGSTRRLGELYYQDKYVSQDIKKTIFYHSKCASLNILSSQLFLGDLYFEGKYVSQDIDLSTHYFRMAKSKSITALNMLGNIYLNYKHNINKSILYYSLAAQTNNKKALFNLGKIYLDEKNSQYDIKKAVYYLHNASNKGSLKSQKLLGDIYYNQKYFENAIPYFTLASKKGDSDSMLKLGKIYISHDINKAIFYFTSASNKKNYEAQYILGMIFYENIYIKRSINKAIYYLSKAAKHKILEAQKVLGKIYYDDEFVPRNITKAIKYFTSASLQNDLSSQLILGDIFLEGKYVKRNMDKSISYYYKAACQDDESALVILGDIYYKSMDIKHDIKKAINYYKKAADKYNIHSLESLGDIYFKGEYIEKNIDVSLQYFYMAADLGSNYALTKIGYYYYEMGLIEKGIHYITEAANNRYESALLILGEIYIYKGKYDIKSFYKGVDYLLLASNQKSSTAQCILGEIYLKGIHVHKNAINALYFFEKSALNGCDLAKLFMADMYLLGKDVNQDIKKAFQLYIDVTICNYRHVKNNIGVIYNKGFNVVEKNVQSAQMFFRECIHSHTNPFAMYNLANILLDEVENKSENGNYYYPKEAIELLLKSSETFDKSKILFCLLLWDKYKLIDIEIIENELMKYGSYSNFFVKNLYYVFMNYQNYEISPKKNYELLKKMRNINYIFIDSVEVTTIEIENAETIYNENDNNLKNKNINDDFIDGFGRDIF